MLSKRNRGVLVDCVGVAIALLPACIFGSETSKSGYESRYARGTLLFIPVFHDLIC